MIYDAIGEEKIDKISISLDVYNDTEELMTVYADDLNIKTGPTTEINILSDEFKQMVANFMFESEKEKDIDPRL